MKNENINPILIAIPLTLLTVLGIIALFWWLEMRIEDKPQTDYNWVQLHQTDTIDIEMESLIIVSDSLITIDSILIDFSAPKIEVWENIDNTFPENVAKDNSFAHSDSIEIIIKHIN